MKCQTNKTNISICRPLKILPKVLSVKKNVNTVPEYEKSVNRNSSLKNAHKWPGVYLVEIKRHYVFCNIFIHIDVHCN